METYFHNQANSGIASILAWRALALGINIKSSGVYNDVVPLPSEKIAFQNISVSRQEIGHYFQKLIGQATLIMINDLLIKPTWWQEARDHISLEQASPFENIQNREAYWNFLTPNPIMQKLKSFLYQNILQDTDLSRKWFTVNGTIRANQKAIYFKHLYDFQAILMVLIHGTSGGPPRGSEVPPILLTNTPQSIRTLFMDRRHHLFMLRLRYSKTSNRHYIEQQAIRVLPESVSYLILAYLGLVLPFTQFIDIMETKEYSRSRELLFWHKDQLINERVLGRRLCTNSQKIIGQRINLRSFRHIIQGFIRYYMSYNIEDPWSSENGMWSRFFYFFIFYFSIFLFFYFSIFHIFLSTYGPKPEAPN
jgi:hypothetical protein